jgi:AbrB family looped-hinge helix DNA binding protein
MQTSSITSKGQATIPLAIRRRLGLRPGGKVAFVLEKDRVVLKAVKRDIGSAFGLVKAKRRVSLRDMEKAIRARAGR